MWFSIKSEQDYRQFSKANEIFMAVNNFHLIVENYLMFATPTSLNIANGILSAATFIEF